MSTPNTDLSNLRDRPAWAGMEYLVLLGLAALLGYWQWQYRGYVKDDAFISLRYARNLSQGLGVVFNPGDRLEGYTNFLWIIFSVPAFWLGIDPLTWVKALACFFGQVGLLITFWASRFFAGDRHDGYTLLAPALWATSTSVVLWSQGGLEPTLMATLCSGGTLLAMMLWSRDGDHDPDARMLAIGSAVLLAGAGLTRPDAHLFGLVAGAFAVADMVRRRSISRHWLLWGAILLGVLAPYHAWRFTYFGDLFPNTMYVKASAGPEVWAKGREFVASLLGFNVNPAVFGLAVLAPLGAPRRIAKLWGLLLTTLVLLYMVKIGRDEMKYFRLFLPLYPLTLALGGDGVRQIGRGLARGLEMTGVPPAKSWVLPVLLALGVGAWGAAFCVDFTASKQKWNSNFLRWSERSFMEMGNYVSERSEPGDVIVFQDMGAAPFTAGELTWIDTIGILSRFVGEQCRKHRVNPFMKGIRRRTEGGREAVAAYEKAIREHIFENDPDWIAFIAYVPKNKRTKFGRSVKKAVRGDGDVEALFRPRLRSNGHTQGVTSDRRFAEGYTFEAHWKRNAGYWVVLYKKNES
ncbi:MAG: hypothetical protein KDA24_08745 [Deltaproteobacteria bacterium]|nr:hypothetical protein [Deltaproteobacteria bacterium]